MLVLSRRRSETIHIGTDIDVVVVGIGTNKVWLGINAPMDTRIVRGELLDEPITSYEPTKQQLFIALKNFLADVSCGNMNSESMRVAADLVKGLEAAA